MHMSEGMQKLLDLLLTRPPLSEDQVKARGLAWREAVVALIVTLENWLQPLVAANVVTVTRTEHDLQDMWMGSNTVPGLVMRYGLVEVRFEPLGVQAARCVAPDIFMAEGRVDIVCGPHSVPLILKEEKWYAVSLRGRSSELTEDILSCILAEMLL